MRTTRFPHLLLAGLLAALPALAGEVSDPATAHVPVGTKVCLRLPSLDRIDEAAVQLKPVIELFASYEGPWGDLGKKPPSEMILQSFDLGAGVAIDRTRPIYLAFVDDDDPYFVLPSGGGLPWEGEKALKDGRIAVLRGTAICVGRAADARAEPRGQVTSMLDGDLSAHVYLGEIIEAARKKIDEGFAEMNEGIKNAPFPLPEKAQTAIKALLGPARDAVYGMESMGYALTLREGRLESEGVVRTKPRSTLRTFIAGAGEAGENDLALMLPSDLFIASDSVTSPTWSSKELADLMDQKLGAGSSAALTALMFPQDVLGELWTGRSASGVQMTGFSGGNFMVLEVSDAAKAKELLASFDPAACNQALTDLGIPIALTYDAGAEQDGETALHRMAITTDNPQLAMFTMGAQSYYAVEGSYVVAASGLSAAAMLKAGLERIRSGERAENPHLAAMQRLGKKRNMGISINLGAMKPMAQMFAFQAPQALPYINAIPDQFYMSTAFTFAGGDIRWRGDWPLKELTEMTKRVAEIALEKKAKAELEEDFD